MSPHFKLHSAAVGPIDYKVGIMQLIENQTSDTALRSALMLARPRWRSTCQSSSPRAKKIKSRG